MSSNEPPSCATFCSSASNVCTSPSLASASLRPSVVTQNVTNSHSNAICVQLSHNASPEEIAECNNSVTEMQISCEPYHHILASRDSGCVSAHDYHTIASDSSSRLSLVSPVTPHSLPDLRSTTSSASIASSASDESNTSDFASSSRLQSFDTCDENKCLPQSSTNSFANDVSGAHFIAITATAGATSLSRQQLLAGPCPICGDRISGFHYGIFSCESCKGFFKRTVQNKKNYVCLRGSSCHVTITTRKKCPACRFDKCLKMGMKLEAIREDRTRGGRSTYQCSYTLSPQSLTESRIHDIVTSFPSTHDSSIHSRVTSQRESPIEMFRPKREPQLDNEMMSIAATEPVIPQLIQEILSVEHLWHNADKDFDFARNGEQTHKDLTSNDFDLRNIADHRLYKIVKWCKSLPLFREIQMDDQIALLINSWCELLLLSCCYRSISTPNEIRLSSGRCVTLRQSQQLGLGTVIERMLNLTDDLRRLQFDQCEYCCLKVIILLTSDASSLKEADKVRSCQKQVLEALQSYTLSHYPRQPSKFGELLLRIPDLERTSQAGKESLVSKQKEGDVPSFNLLMELLRGDH